MTDEIVELEDFALELAHTAGGIAQAHFRRPITVENKSPNAFDPVTNADRAIERVLRTAIVARYPEHGIVAEEEGERSGAGEYTWFIDPIDGTRAFMTGSPLWGTLIGLSRARRSRCSACWCSPCSRKCFSAARAAAGSSSPSAAIDCRAALAKRLRRPCSRARIPTCSTASAHRRFARSPTNACCTRFGGDCYNYAMVAAGYLDLVVESQLKPYDIVPLIPILEGAGCIVTDWQGDRRSPAATSSPPGSRELHKAALELRCEPDGWPVNGFVELTGGLGLGCREWSTARLTEYGPAHDKDVEKRATTRAGTRAARAKSSSTAAVTASGAGRVTCIESTSVLLKRLENKDLALEPTQKVPVMQRRRACVGQLQASGGVRTRSRQTPSGARIPRCRASVERTSGGFDPYNSR